LEQWEREQIRNENNNFNDNNNLGDNIELVECHNEPTSASTVTIVPANGNKPPKLNTLPTLSISQPSPPAEKLEEDFL
jgi:hypothetical protein